MTLPAAGPSQPAGLRTRAGGDGAAGSPVLVLLHGLGATSDVWRPLEPVLADAWPGRWLAVDLPGHGGSAPLPVYAVGTLAAAVAATLAATATTGPTTTGLTTTGLTTTGPATTGPGTEVRVLGHSLGGAVGLALASGWYGVGVQAVAAVGVKTAWTDEEVDRGRALAARPLQVLPDREAALDRHLRLAGLTGLVGPGDPAAGGDVAVVPEGSGWRPALDPRAFGVSLAGIAPGLVAAATAGADVLLARGEHDVMAPSAAYAGLGAPVADLPGLGHNAHVEDAAALWAGVRDVLLPGTGSS